MAKPVIMILYEMHLVKSMKTIFQENTYEINAILEEILFGVLFHPLSDVAPRASTTDFPQVYS